MKYSDMLGKLTPTRRCNSLQERRQPLRTENNPGFQINQNLGHLILQLQRNKFCQKSKWTWKQIVSQSSHQIRAPTHLYCSFKFSSVQFSSVAQSSSTLCDTMDCSMPGFPVHHQLLELTQILVQWCHQAISSSVIPFSSCLQSFPGSAPFPVSQFFPSGGQSIEVSASASVLPIQDWFPLGWTERPQCF